MSKEITERYPEHIIEKLRQRQDLDIDDCSMDDEFQQMAPNEVFHEVLNWEGFLGSWDSTIKGWIEDIYCIDLDDFDQ